MQAYFHIRYIYTYYSFDEILDTGVYDERFPVAEGSRFTLHSQEDSSFLSSEVGMLPDGRRRAILTFPNKDRIVLAEGDEVELCYDEFFESMGGNNHNVYEGTVALELE